MRKKFISVIGLLIMAALLGGCTAEQPAVWEEKQYTAEETVTALQIDVQDRKVILEPSPDQLIHLS